MYLRSLRAGLERDMLLGNDYSGSYTAPQVQSVRMLVPALAVRNGLHGPLSKVFEVVCLRLRRDKVIRCR